MDMDPEYHNRSTPEAERLVSSNQNGVVLKTARSEGSLYSKMVYVEAEARPLVAEMSFVRRFCILCSILSVIFGAGICVSILGPLYPDLANEKGLTSSEYGLVFGILPLVVCVISPFLGSNVQAIGPKLLFNVGSTIVAVATICFGLLEYVPAGSPFFLTSLLIRFVMGFGDGAMWTTAYLMGPKLFPDNMATVFAAIESTIAIGVVVGPAAGGIIYEFWGYAATFMCSGFAMLFFCLFACLLVPHLPDDTVIRKSSSGDRGKQGLLQLFRIKVVYIPMYALLSVSFSVGFYVALLEEHIRKFNLSKMSVGFVFIASGGSYGVMAPIFGKIVDKYKVYMPITIGCSFLAIVAYLLMGPAPFMPLNQTVGLTVASLCLNGVAMAGLFVSACLDIVKTVIANGFPDNNNTIGLTSGMFTCLFAMGTFLGPSIGGILNYNFSFEYSSMLVALMFVITAILTGGRYIREKTKQRNRKCESSFKESHPVA